jgi:hypothetical protein
MELAFAFLSRAAERSHDGTIHAFGAGFDKLTLPQVAAATTPIVLVAKFRCEPVERGQVHEIGVDLSDPHGVRARLVSERIVIGEGIQNENGPLGATLVASVDAPLKTAGEHVILVSLDGIQIASLSITVQQNGDHDPSGDAMLIRAQWMHELGMSEDEIAPLCDAQAYTARTEEESANLSALRRMRSSKWSI